MPMLRLALLLAACAILSSCGGGGGLDNEAAFRLIQASPDAPLVNLRVDGVAVRSATDYRSGTGYIFVNPRNYDFSVEAILPGGNQTVVDAPGTPILAGREYTVIAIGKAATSSVEALIVDNPIEDIAADMTRLEIVHAAPDVAPVDVYVTAKDADLLTEIPLVSQVTYGDQPTGRIAVPSGTYVVRVTPAGLKSPVLFESTELTLRSRDDLLLVAVANTQTGDSPIELVANNRSLNATLLDVATPSDLRVVHASPDAPALDVVGDPSTEASPEVTFASGLNYLENTGYVSAPPELYNVRGVATADPMPETPPFSFTGTFVTGQRATLFALGLFATINDLVLVDNTRPVFGLGQLRIVHGAPGAGTADVYIQPTGTDINSVEPTLINLVLRSSTTHISVAPDNYTVTFTTAGTKDVLASADVPATDARVFTVVLRDAPRPDEASDGKPAGVLLLDDLIT